MSKNDSLVVSPGIEPGSPVPQTDVLSVELRDLVADSIVEATIVNSPLSSAVLQFFSQEKGALRIPVQIVRVCQRSSSSRVTVVWYPLYSITVAVV